MFLPPLSGVDGALNRSSHTKRSPTSAAAQTLTPPQAMQAAVRPGLQQCGGQQEVRLRVLGA